MRDIAVTFIVLVGCVYTLKRPYIGILLWSWLSYMNPHRLTYGFAYDMPFAYIAAIFIIISTLFSKEIKRFPVTPITITWIGFVLFMGLTTLFAYYPELSSIRYTQVFKVQLIAFISLMLLTDLYKINQLLWVIVISIGYFSVKGGIFTLLTGGAHRVWGPPGSLIEGNNELAVASLMIIPLMAYLHQINANKWIKKGLALAIGLSFVGAIGTQSRGALIATAAVAYFFWRKSNRKLLMALLLGVGVISLLTFMPQSWYDRMNTIKAYDEDASAMGRINAWEYAFNAANHRLFGMGFDSWSGETFALYAPNPNDPHAAHSIYFSVLGDHGWIGLALFLSIFFMSIRLLTKIIKKEHYPKDILILAKMIQVSLIAYLVGGAFLSLSYYDLPWGLVGIIVCLRRILDETDIKGKRALKNERKIIYQTNA